LLASAFKAAGKQRLFTADQVKKFRQRHLPNLARLLRKGDSSYPQDSSRPVP
jgi:hypothetical protein